MATLFEIVRLVTLVVLGVAFVLSCAGLFDVIQHKNYNNAEAMTSVIITTIVTLVGLLGSYQNNRTYLIGFSLIVFIAVIVGFVSKSVVYYSLGFCLLAAVMALVQAETMRRSF